MVRVVVVVGVVMGVARNTLPHKHKAKDGGSVQAGKRTHRHSHLINTHAHTIIKKKNTHTPHRHMIRLHGRRQSAGKTAP